MNDEIRRRLRDGEAVAAATVVRTWHSAPQPAGATMFVAETGAAFGSVSGGCVEAEVYAFAQQVLDDGIPVLQRFGVADDDAFAVGLTCGGTLEVFIRRLDRGPYPEFEETGAQCRDLVAVATVISATNPVRVGSRLVIRADSVSGSLGSPGADAAVSRAVGASSPQQEDAEVMRYRPVGGTSGDELEVLISRYRRPPRMIIFGAVDFAAAMAEIGSFLGYHVTVCDARPVFATAARLPTADEVVVQWPHLYLRAERDATRITSSTVLIVLTHDAKFDVPLLDVALRDAGWAQRPGYIGAIGSRKTHSERLARLRDIGLTDAELGRLRAPIGLNLGAVTPAETAVSIAAEIIAERRGGDHRSLADTRGPIHARAHPRRPRNVDR